MEYNPLIDVFMGDRRTAIQEVSFVERWVRTGKAYYVANPVAILTSVATFLIIGDRDLAAGSVVALIAISCMPYHARRVEGMRRGNYDGPLSDGVNYNSSHTAVTRKLWSCKSMKIQGLKWRGEGYLFSRWSLKTRKLYTSRSAQTSQSARNTKSSHTASHTGCPGVHPVQFLEAA
jgi:hypothetical protein